MHFSFALRATTLSNVVWHSIRFSIFRRASTKWSDESSLTPHRHANRLHPSDLQFPGQPLQPCSDGTDSTSDAATCLVVRFCKYKVPFWSPSLTRSPVRVAYSSAFLFHCRRLIPGSGKRECWFQRLIQEVCRIPSCAYSEEGLPCLVTLHLCKATLTVCRPDLEAPDLHWTVGIFGNPDSCCLQFSGVLHKLVW